MAGLTRIGMFEVVRELGRGGMGVVLEVRSPTLPGKRLALKLILPSVVNEAALARFGREAELLARVKHPGVVAVHTLGRAPEGPYLVTEFVEGSPLRSLADAGVTPELAARLVRDLARAVEAVHAVGVIHRDIKPDNVMLRPDGTPVLLDFGVARGAGAESLTQTGAVVGTLNYMAPEQCEGHRAEGAAPVDERADVYGLGAVLFHLLARAKPFEERGGGMALMHAVLDLEPRWPAGPPALLAVCKLAMARRPEQRYASARELADDLDRVLVGEPPRALGLAPRRRAPVGLLAAALVSVAALASIALAARRQEPTDPAPTTTTSPTPPASESKVVPPAPPPRPAVAHVDAPGVVSVAWLGERLVTATVTSTTIWSVDDGVATVVEALPFGGRLAATDSGRLHVASGEVVNTFDITLGPGKPFHYDERRPTPVLGAFGVSPDGRWIAWGDLGNGEAGLGIRGRRYQDLHGADPDRRHGYMRDVAFGEGIVVAVSDRASAHEGCAAYVWALPEAEDDVRWRGTVTLYTTQPRGYTHVALAGKRIVTADESGAVYADLESTVPVRPPALYTHGAPIVDLVATEEAIYSLSCDAAGASELRRWPLAGDDRGEPIRWTTPHGCLALDSTRRWLAVGGPDGVELVDLQPPRPVAARWLPHADTPDEKRAVAAQWVGQRLVVAGATRLTIWEPGLEASSVVTPSLPALAIVALPGGRSVLCGAGDTLQRLDVTRGRLSPPVKVPDARSITALAVSPRGDEVAIEAKDPELLLVPYERDGPARWVECKGTVVDVAFSRDGAHLAAALATDEDILGCAVRAWRIPSRTAALVHASGEQVTWQGFYSVTFTPPPDPTLIAGDGNGRILLLDPVDLSRVRASLQGEPHGEAGAPQHTIVSEELVRVAHFGRVRGLALSPDGAWLYSVAHDDERTGASELRVWDLRARREVRRVELDGLRWRAHLDRDGRTLVVTGAGGVDVFDAESLRR